MGPPGDPDPSSLEEGDRKNFFFGGGGASFFGGGVGKGPGGDVIHPGAQQELGALVSLIRSLLER